MAAANDIETIECSDSDNDSNGAPDKPLMQLFGRLIGSDKQNTVLTNAQLVEILQTEFDIDILDLHELEVEIYLNIMKKFLKDWPQWDELDKIIKQEQGNYKSIQEIIQVKYKNLKDYLKVIIDTSKPMAKETVANALKQTAGKIKKVQIDTSDIVMEVQCTRSQLNQLFFRHPIPDQNNTIFNISSTPPSQIIVDTMSLSACLNWWDVSMTVNLPGFQYTRVPTHQLKHLLINRKLEKEMSESNELNQELEIKADTKKDFSYLKTAKLSKTAIINYINKVLELENPDPYLHNQGEIIFKIIKNDLQNFTDYICVPGMYRRFVNKYKYVRYLYKDIPIESISRKYDLCLEETISPQINYSICRFDPNNVKIPDDDSWLTLECLTCSEKFSLETVEMMKQHFMLHQTEPYWNCTNCNKEFSMSMLVHQSWEHKC